MSRGIAVTAALIAMLNSGAEAKRKPAGTVKPLISSGMAFSLVTNVDEKGLDVWLTATVTGKNNKPFHRLVYRISFDPRMETDAQTIYPVSMSIRRGVVRVMDERGKYFKVSVIELTGTGTGASATAK